MKAIFVIEKDRSLESGIEEIGQLPEDDIMCAAAKGAAITLYQQIGHSDAALVSIYTNQDSAEVKVERNWFK